MNLEELLRTAVDDGVRSVPPGLADGAIRRAKRQRRTTRIAVAGGVAAFGLAAAAIAVVDPTEIRTDAPPAGGTDGTVVDLAHLDAGPPPEIAWYADGALHHGTESTPFDLETDYPVIIRLPDGYLVWESVPGPDSADHTATIWLVPDDGERVELGSGDLTPPVVSAAGDIAAWGVRNDDWVLDEEAREQGVTSSIVVVDLTTGEVAHRLDEAPSPSASPKGFVREDRVVFEAAANTAWGAYVWEFDGEVTLLRADTGVDAVSQGTGLVRLAASPPMTLDLEAGTTLVPEADPGWPVYSPGGRYVATITRPGTTLGTGTGRDQLVIRDAYSGEEVVRLDTEAPESLPVWENETGLVFGAYQDGATAALVRCTVDGECELATEPQVLDDDPDTFDIPYRTSNW
ncbi:hypothetical protein [Jiangella mangrovi]|uniref:WD40 repeat domain-containing protein n=1 Tax=Jiangella mangrovi TaxID=1524084 RepID=A0A7W9GWP5_9ACTN|nr:hypothetical protein [Jiangella mangrovi]MBB5791362.1 hypothetical protein [Jiangella mangrovi]